MPTRSATRHEDPPEVVAPLPDPVSLARAFAVLRGFFGVLFLANGLAKVFEVHRIEVGPLVANLIDRGDTRFILDVEANRNAQDPLPGLRAVVNDVLLANFGFFQWAITAAELGIGLLLVLGLASRLAALLGLAQALALSLLYLSNDRWLFEHPLEVVPLALLAVVASGRVWGVDGSPWLPERWRGRWPF